MKLVSWNVNGLRAAMDKGFLEAYNGLDADIMCLQETKMQPEHTSQIILNDTVSKYYNFADKKGYSGTVTFSKVRPVSVAFGIGIDEHDHEGRVVTLEFEKFYLVNVYTPNSQRGLTRLDYRIHWEDDFQNYLLKLKATKEVIVCGDMNVAHKEIDIARPKSNMNNAGFTIEERNKMTQLLDSGFIDTFRYFHPNETGAYSWWSYMRNSRENNIGWRLDYFLASEGLKDNLVDAKIHSEIYGSDHCPIELDIDI